MDVYLTSYPLIRRDIVLLSKCAELWVFGEKITSGMSIEIEKAKRKGQLIRYFTETCEEVCR